MDHIFYYLIAGFHIAFGTIMRRFNLANLIITYSQKKYDEKEMSRLCGNHLILLGLLLILVLAIIDFIIMGNPQEANGLLKFYEYYFMLLHVLIVVSFYIRLRNVPHN